MNRFLLLLYGSICLLVFLRVILASKPVDLPDGAKITANVRIVSSPQVFYGHQEIPVTIKEQKVILILPEFSEYRYGDQVRISGILKKKVLDNKKTVYSIYFPSIQKVKGDMGVFYQAAGFVRVRVTEAFNRYLPPNEASLLLGVVLGVSSTVSKDLKLDFQTTRSESVV